MPNAVSFSCLGDNKLRCKKIPASRRPTEQLSRRSDFDNPPVFHHGDPIRDGAGGAQIMGDEQDCHLGLHLHPIE